MKGFAKANLLMSEIIKFSIFSLFDVTLLYYLRCGFIGFAGLNYYYYLINLLLTDMTFSMIGMSI